MHAEPGGDGQRRVTLDGIIRWQGSKTQPVSLSEVRDSRPCQPSKGEHQLSATRTRRS